MIPNNITRNDILKAMDEIDAKGVPDDRLPRKFNVIYNGRKYPPKYVISIANKYANGKELRPDQFSGGMAFYS